MASFDFQELMGKYRDQVYGLAMCSLRNREDAEDVTQEVLVRLWRHRRKLPEQAVRPWLMRVTRNACCDSVRRRRSGARRLEQDASDERLMEVPCAAPDPHATAETAEFQRQLLSAMDRLPERQRQTLYLREIEQLSYDEIASAMDRSLSAVKVDLHRGRRRLRDVLREVNADGQGAYVHAS